MAQTFPQLMSRPAGARSVVFEVSPSGLYTDFPNGNVAVKQYGAEWVVMPRAEWRTPKRSFVSALAAFNYARHCVRA